MNDDSAADKIVAQNKAADDLLKRMDTIFSGGGSLYEQINSGDRGKSLHETSSQYDKASKQLADSAHRVHHHAEKLASSWQGQASEKHQAAVKRIVEHFDRGADAAHGSRHAVTQQAEQFSHARGTIQPEPEAPQLSGIQKAFIPVDQAKLDRAVQQEGAKTQSANAAAYHRYQQATQQNSDQVRQATAQFSEQPNQDRHQGGQDKNQQNHTAKHSSAPPAGGHTGSGNGGSMQPATAAATQQGQAPAIQSATDAGPGQAGGHGAGPGGHGAGPGGQSAPGQSPGSGTQPSSVPQSQPVGTGNSASAPGGGGYGTGRGSAGSRNGYGTGGGVAGPGGLGEFGRGGATGANPGGGTEYGTGRGSAGGARGMGGGSGPGRGGATGARPDGRGAGAAEAAERSAAGGAGRGNTMMPPGGGAGGRGNKDDEHKTASYLVTDENANEIVGKLPPTVPPVIE